MSCVYEQRCTVTGKSYIGKTARSAKDRWAQHVYLSRSSQLPFHRAIKRYGPAAFKLVIHGNNLSEAVAFQMERALIASLGTKVPAGYNLTDGGEGNLGYVPTPEVRKKIGDALRGRKRQPLSESMKAILRAKNIGKTHTPETRAKLSAMSKTQHTDNPISADSRAKAAAALRGYKHTEQAKVNMRAAALARPVASAEHRANLSTAMRGHEVSELTRTKLAAANRGQTRSDEAKKNMSVAAKARYERVRQERDRTIQPLSIPKEFM